MKRHFQCAEQQEAASNFTNCCACHTKWMSTSDLRHISNVISNAQSKWSHPPTSPNATPAIGKWMSPVICDTYQTSFPMRGASKGTLQPHQILRLPRKMQVINDLRHICNLISNARSKQRHPATSPNTAPATQNASHQWSASHMQPHFQCVEAVKSPSNLTKHCACHEILKLKISAETPWMLPPIERRFDDNPRISDQIRPDPTISDDKIVISHPPLPRPYSSHFGRRFCIVKYNISRPGYLPKCHEVLRLSRKSHPPTSPNTAPATQSELWTVTLLNCYLTDLLLDWTVSTWLICYYLTDLLLYWSVTSLICYFTDLLLHWSVTWLICWLICSFTDLLLYWSVTSLICYLTDLLLDWSVTLLICYFTELWLDWSVTLLNWSVTLLNWSVTLLNC